MTTITAIRIDATTLGSAATPEDNEAFRACVARAYPDADVTLSDTELPASQRVECDCAGACDCASEVNARVNGLFNAGDWHVGDIEVIMDTPNGPVIQYSPRHEPEDVDAAVPAGWERSEAEAVRLSDGRYSAPMVRAAAR